KGGITRGLHLPGHERLRVVGQEGLRAQQRGQLQDELGGSGGTGLEGVVVLRHAALLRRRGCRPGWVGGPRGRGPKGPPRAWGEGAGGGPAPRDNRAAARRPGSGCWGGGRDDRRGSATSLPRRSRSWWSA